jgi:hypothetical protein
MQTTGLTTHHAGADSAGKSRHSHTDEPPGDEIVHESLDLLEFVPVAGPPVLLLAIPLVLLALMVAGPFVVVLTLVVLVVAAAAVLALAALVVASPYLLVRHFRGRERRPASRKPFRAPRLAPMRSREAQA